MNQMTSVYHAAMGARRHGQEGTLAPLWKCCEVFLCISIVAAKRSVDELFMHYFYNLSSASRIFALTRIHPWTPLGDFCPQTPNLPTPGKNPAGAHEPHTRRHHHQGTLQPYGG